MKHRFLVAIASAAALGACASGTQVSAGGEVSSATPATRDLLPAGTTMMAKLDQAISTSSNEGDAFAATVTEPVLAQDGSTAVPAGATLRGHITGVHSAKLPGEQNVIRLNFEELTMNGQTYPFSGSISNVKVENASGVSSTTARDATAGAAAGAVLGAVLSGGELSKILTGGLLGAAAGTVISMGTGGGAAEATIPSGSAVTVKSNQAIQVK